jgi:deoxyadenosine/deoxycytidine kinase
MKRFIVVAGNIGVGKSSLVMLLSRRLGYQAFLEPEADNPYLEDFYQDMSAWSFHSQVFFLARRLRILVGIIHQPMPAIQDRSIYEDAEVFAYNLYLQGTMGQRDYQTYHDLYQSLVDFLPPPDLVIYLRASVDTLHERISQRARGYERDISREYLQRLNQLYGLWISNFSVCPVLTVPADDLDFVAQPDHLELIAQKVEEKLAGKEEVSFDL